MNSFEQLMRDGSEDKQKGPMSKTEAKERGRTLRGMRTTYLKEHSFSAGDLVTQKDGLDIYRHPADGEPAVVMEVLKGKDKISCDTGGVWDKSDMIIGVYRNSALDLVGADSSRFEPFKG